MARGKLHIRTSVRQSRRITTGTVVGIASALFVVTIACVLAISSNGCTTTGISARQEALRPAAKRTWSGVLSDFETGVQDAVDATDLDTSGANLLIDEANKITEAFNLKTTLQQLNDALVVWPSLEPFARRGVESQVRNGSISQGVADSKLERIRLFGLTVAKLAERTGG